MRVGMVGLASLYWPIAIGRGLQERRSSASQGEGVEFLAAATLGADELAIRGTLGISAAEYAGRFKLRLYEQAEQMIARERLDTVVLITRHSQHALWAERLAALGMKMFIPKTFATTSWDADRIVQAGMSSGVKIAVGPTARYLPAMMAAKQAIDEGRIGKPFSLRICHHHGTIDVFNRQDWYRDSEEGGPELSLGWYGVDLMLYFMGSPGGVSGGERAKTVYAQYGNFTSPDSPFMDCGRITLRMESGGIASFDMYFCNRMSYPSWQMEIVGPKGVVSIHRVEVKDPLQKGDSSKTVVSLDSANGYELLPIPAVTPGWEMFWVEDFLAGREPAITAETARLITNITLAARESAHRGAVINL
jgi:UDP-N-acetylglucosamine 3-dehydrogenase